MKHNTERLEDIFQKHLPTDELAEVERILYGKAFPSLEFSAGTLNQAKSLNCELRGYSIPCPKEETRAERRIRVATIQNGSILPTTAPVSEQRNAILSRIGSMIKVAAGAGANIVLRAEMFSMPFGFSTHEQQPWVQFAESAENGPTVSFLSELARRHNMVIIASIYEKDPQGRSLNWNTAVVISETGRVIGKTHKNHLPQMDDGNETIYFHESTQGHPVFETKFGRLGIVICYGRHFPMNWAQLALNGAEMIFNPAAITEVSETLWGFEARNAAIANNCYTFAVNRVGTETFKTASKDSVNYGHFFGSNYCATPDGNRTLGLSRTREGVLITELDLNLCRQASDNWGFKMTQRLDLYGPKMTEASKSDYKQQRVQ